MSDPFDFDRAADQYGVMGNPIAHSKSPWIHREFARQTSQKLVYTAMLVEPGGLSQAVGNFIANGGKGLNITVPFKQDAWHLADKKTERAQLAGAVNTLIVNEDATLLGDNTDGIGLVRDICQNHQQILEDKKILILGAGGASRGVIAPMLEQKPQRLAIANRTLSRAEELASHFQHLAEIDAMGFDDLHDQHFDLIINATSASLQGEMPPLPDSLASADVWCYDMMYGKEPTIFMQWAQRQGAIAVDGLGMLVEQAAESFYLWRQSRPETRNVIQQLRASL